MPMSAGMSSSTAAFPKLSRCPQRHRWHAGFCSALSSARPRRFQMWIDERPPAARTGTARDSRFHWIGLELPGGAAQTRNGKRGQSTREDDTGAAVDRGRQSVDEGLPALVAAVASKDGRENRDTEDTTGFPNRVVGPRGLALLART